MGGRGGSSGFSTSKETYKFSVSNLTGSEKQKAWAQRIVDDALGTINTNIKNFTVGMQKITQMQKQLPKDIRLLETVSCRL